MMKKILTTLLFAVTLCFATACNMITNSIESNDSSSISVSEDNSMNAEPHEHRLTKVMANASTCKKEGNIEFYFCTDCSGYFEDENAEVETTYKATRIAKSAHVGEKNEGIPATCGTPGIIDHCICTDCNQMFSDEACTVAVTEEQLQLEKIAHRNMVHNEGFPVYEEQNGEKEHWYCEDCDGYFLSVDATEVVTREDIILYSAVNIPDFMVEIPSGRAPIVLQLSDTQIIDGAQSRPDKSEGDKITYATELIKQYCYDYLTEIITATKPDFIIITGDLVYGEYDDNGSVFKAFVEFMDSFQIPWAPVFGNHDNESAMGVDWQCEQLENAKYCLFEQKELTGNGNYSVGIMQDGKIKRVFYMLDTNGCTNASEASLQNGHTSKRTGFGSDQIEWYTEQINELKALSPETKISFAYHIQQAVFGEAYRKYGFNQDTKYQDIYVDYQDNHTEGDFGYLGRQMKDPWDSDKTIYNGMKELGVDSIFVGHEHCNSASVVYEGIRFQYGQKSSEYDRYNAMTDAGEIVASQIWNKMGTPLVGGSVIVLSKEDGSIADAYIYYCENAGGNIDWDAVMQK
jgi:hypothetical protein